MYLTGDNIAKEKLLKLAARCQLPIWPSAQKPFLHQGNFEEMPKSLCVVADKLTESRLEMLFQMPITVLIDAQATIKSIADFITQQKHYTVSSGLSFLSTGPVVYQFDVAQIFAKTLQKRQGFSDFRFESIHLALHKALVNGLIHGNLRLSSKLKQNITEYNSYSDLVKERLNTPAYARKAISIAAQWDCNRMKITVRDEGMGYSLGKNLKHSAGTRTVSGRGLRIIAGLADSCTIDNYGREISLSFLREKSAAPDILPIDITVPNSAFPQEDVSRAKVLIIEDDRSNQALLGGLLSQLGIKQIDFAEDGIQGLNKALTFEPDLIILNINIPKLNGFDVLKKLKSAPATHSIPVLIQTISDVREVRDKTFKSGASDFITNPINPLEFFARVRIHLENKMLINRLQKRLKQIHSELSAAQSMQTGLLPTVQLLQDVRRRYGLDVVSYFEPSDKLGGDFWQITELDNQRIGLYLCDFSGHGLASALNTFRLHTLIFQMQEKIKQPSDFLSILNYHLHTLLQRGQFATFFFCIYNYADSTLTYSGAAAPAPFLWNGKKWQALPTRGLPLGISQTAQYENQTVPFRPGNRLFIYSDALTESVNDNKEQMNMKTLMRFVKETTANMPIREGLSGIMSRFFSFAPPPVNDDVTAVLIEAQKLTQKRS